MPVVPVVGAMGPTAAGSSVFAVGGGGAGAGVVGGGEALVGKEIGELKAELIKVAARLTPGDTTPCRMTGVTLHSHVRYKDINVRTCCGPLFSSVDLYSHTMTG